MTSRRLRPWDREPVPAEAGRRSARRPAGPVGPPAGSPPLSDEPERRHEALVGVRLTAATPGSHLLDYLRTEPCAVEAWWIAADIDAVVRLSATSLSVLHRAVEDLRRRGGAEVVATHSILRPLDLPVPTDSPAATVPVPVPARA
ncbi:hypothetical protein ACFOOK_24045 [Micromonospora krabiensis]|uniref:AsnC family protein n=1 Tax=Micromonospora krabiensis TaxID=307121 RepID=A0A1C3N707_9ACTN|nr:hypothetical protein [Micromonospora krabiensis]SBV28361.1 hypothetical protein GA0070620_3904 [Micromonospora krabiensis]